MKSNNTRCVWSALTTDPQASCRVLVPLWEAEKARIQEVVE